MSRAPFIPRETLEPLVKERRAQGMTWKEIAREVGHYHPVYLAAKCATWNIGAIYCAGAIASNAKTVAEYSRASPSSDQAPPPREATPGNSP